MKFKNIFNINTEKKLAFANTLVFALIAVILYFTLPFVLNYPPNSIDNEFHAISYFNCNFTDFIIYHFENCL